MLSNHNSGCTIIGPPDPRHLETIPQPGEIVGPLSQVELFLVDDVRVVVVSRGNDRVGSQTEERVECLVVLSVLHEPTRRFRGEPDTEHEDESGNESGAELKTPGNLAGILDDNVGSETKEDTYLSLAYV